QWNVLVRSSRQNDLCPRHLLEELLDAERDVQDQFRLVDRFTLGPRIVAAMARIDHDARDAQSELTCDGISAREVPGWSVDGDSSRQRFRRYWRRVRERWGS